jgi:serine/threonine protein kinase
MSVHAQHHTDSPPGAFFSHQPDTEPIPGYRLLGPLGCGGFGEVWKCEAPGGLHKAIKFVQGSLHALDSNPPAEEELRAVQRVKAVRHPFILSMERVEIVRNELVIVLELADRSLADVLVAEQRAGRMGIPRESLLAYLREAAEALDVMNFCHGLQHLDIKPQNLYLVSNHVKVGDFGLVNNFGAGRTHAPALGAITPLYAAPEVFQGTLSAHCDQYSLAIVYQQLLTGTLPFKGRNGQQLLMQHMQAQPDLQPLPAGDREVVARALSKAPGERFSSCSEFVLALMAGLTEVVSSTMGADPPVAISRPEAETRRTSALKTVRVLAISLRPPGLRALEAAGIEVTDMVTRTPLSEVWRGQAADGSARLVKVLFGCAQLDDEPLVRLAAITHPHLAPIQIVDRSPGRLVFSTLPPDRNLRDLLIECQSNGMAGVPREHLLSYLQAAAEVLDFYAHQGLYHLGLNPRMVYFQDDTLLIADFGLAQLIWLPAGKALTALNPRYSAPELSRRQIGAACDQFSLALIYLEMVIGCYPVGAPAQPRLDLVSEADRAVLARALHRDPLQRWPTALEMIAALRQASTAGDSTALPGCLFSGLIAEEAEKASQGGMSGAPLSQGTGPAGDDLPSVPVMQARFGTNLSSSVIRQRLEGFREQRHGEALISEASRLLFHMQTPRSFWQRWTRKQPGLEVDLAVGAPEMEAPEGVQTRTEVRMELRPRGCTREQASELLEAFGPLLIESVRSHLRRTGFGRSEDRLVWHHPLVLHSIEPDGSLGAPIECQGKDISLGGIGFYLPGQLPSSQVLLHLPKTQQTQQAEVPARIVRVQGCGNGWYEVGAVLLSPDHLSSNDLGAFSASSAE